MCVCGCVYVYTYVQSHCDNAKILLRKSFRLEFGHAAQDHLISPVFEFTISLFFFFFSLLLVLWPLWMRYCVGNCLFMVPNHWHFALCNLIGIYGLLLQFYGAAFFVLLQPKAKRQEDNFCVCLTHLRNVMIRAMHMRYTIWNVYLSLFAFNKCTIGSATEVCRGAADWLAVALIRPNLSEYKRKHS